MRYRLTLSHYGFLPDQQKRAYLVACEPRDYDPGSGPFLEAVPETFSVVSVETRITDAAAGSTGTPVVHEGRVELLDTPDPLGVVAVLDLCELTLPGYYQVHAAGARSHPFAIRGDLYARTAYGAFLYSYRQRCGYSVEAWHTACHADDARTPDGRHRDHTGGWHDAGDLRKWMDHTLWQAIGIIWLKRSGTVRWSRYAEHVSGYPDDLLDELAWGNRYFLSMQDPESGRVYHSVGGPEEENRWTDGLQSDDDRSRSDVFSHHLQFKFAWVEQQYATLFAETDPTYAKRCAAAALAAWNAGAAAAAPESGDTLTLSLAVLAAPNVETLAPLLATLVARQHTRGPWAGAFSNPSGPEAGIFCDWWQHAFCGWALFHGADRLTEAGETTAADETLSAAFRYIEDHVMRITGFSRFGCAPLVLSEQETTWDTYRRAGAREYYRFFLPCMSERSEEKHDTGYGQGSNTALLGYAALLAHAGRRFGRVEFRERALRQLEWVHGGNPLGVCMVTGRSGHGFYPHSRYIGLIPDGIANGITGDAADNPHFGAGPYDLEWQTREYWSPQQAQYLMTLVELGETKVSPDIGLLDS